MDARHPIWHQQSHHISPHSAGYPAAALPQYAASATKPAPQQRKSICARLRRWLSRGSQPTKHEGREGGEFFHSHYATQVPDERAWRYRLRHNDVEYGHPPTLYTTSPPPTRISWPPVKNTRQPRTRALGRGHIVVHPALRAGTFEPLLWYFDVRNTPYRTHLQLTETGERVLAAPATSPPQRRFSIECPQFPWKNMIVKGAIFVTVRDVLEEIHRFMWKRVPPEARVFDTGNHTRIRELERTWAQRVGEQRRWKRDEMRVVDWIGKKTKFAGLREEGGRWVMVLAKPKPGENGIDLGVD